ncbi:MAG: hypothetical protein MSC30_16975 [Gaiellaceae bacterium MAG52_C11]|nr:hypothetical protein [Candidatus Gaiellasilicea maunaloa]
MSWALGLGRDTEKRPAAIVALSGFLPQVDGLKLDVRRASRLSDRNRPRRPRPRDRRSLQPRGAGVDGGCRRRLLYREYPLPHTIDPGFLPELRDFVARAIPAK